MINLDKYLCTPDELFNTNAQFWYFEFTGKNKPQTDKSFEVYIQALHNIYFFIQENYNKPFGCIEQIIKVSVGCDFTENEKLIFIDKILGILWHYPDQEKMSMVFIQITDYRNTLSPYTDDPDIQNPKWHFNTESIKSKIINLSDPSDRHKFLMDVLFDYAGLASEIDELEHEYYSSIGFFSWVQAEIKRAEYEQGLDETSKEKPHLGDFTNSQLVLIFYYFFKFNGIIPRVNVDIAPIAKFLHLITGKEFSKTANSDFYKKLSNAPNHTGDKSLIEDLNQIKPFFQKVKLNEIVKMIDNEIDQCRVAIKDANKHK